jgi:DNA-binding SARP family transcriptional activator/tetratricopeptide (TPR) repeat protein
MAPDDRPKAMTYLLLGDLEIRAGGGWLDLPTGPTLRVLAALLLNVNRPMSKADLMRAAWEGEEVQEAQLHKRVSAARDLLAQIGRREDIKTHQRFGYELRADEDDIDAQRFLRLVREAAEAGAAGRTGAEIGLLREAIGLWRGGRPLANVAGEAFTQDVVALEQRHKRAAARLFELELTAGNHELILDELIRVAGFYPADRRLTQQLMVAQYRTGHLTEVARAYEHYRAALAEETAAEPDPVLRTLHFAIASGDEVTTAAAVAALTKRTGAQPPRPVAVAAVPRQLPRAADLVGRTDLTAEVAWLLGRYPRTSVPVVVISGPGGMGKTALALWTAHDNASHYPDGQLYAELHGTAGGPSDTSEVLAQFLRALGASRIPESKAERLAEYRTLLASRRVLVVLDDAADGTQAGDLAPANPECALLVTARRRLPDIAGAHHVGSLEPLPSAIATELFGRVVSDAGLTLARDEDEAVAQVVSLCGGLPLALRIAGALRVHDHPRPASELAARLASQGPAGFAYGHYSVARTIGAGFERLGAGAGRLFLALGLLQLISFGQWTAAALLEDAGVNPDAALSGLAATFMIDSVGAEQHYRFHDLTREYARARALAEYPGDRAAVPGVAYRALLTLLRRANFCLYGGDFEVVHSDTPGWDAPPKALAEVDADPRAWFGKEHANIRAAVAHCAELGLAGIAWDLAMSAHELFTLGGLFDDWHATATTALAACRAAGDRRGEAVMIICLAQPALVASRRTADLPGQADLEQAIAVLAGEGDQHGQAIGLRTLANALRRQGHLTRPLALFTQARGLYEAAGDTVGQWQTLRYIGQTQLYRGDYPEAVHVLEDALKLAEETGRARLIAQSWYWIGLALLASGDLDEAQAAFETVNGGGDGNGGDGEDEDAGDGNGYGLYGLGSVAFQRGDYAEAERRFTMAAGLARDGADAALEGRVLVAIAGLHEAQGRRTEQVELLRRAVAAFAEGDAAFHQAHALRSLAEALTAQGDTDGADAAWARVNRLYSEADLPEQDRFNRPPAP